MSTNIEISVIIPVYNAYEYLSETIDSFLMQTFLNWEMILVNDGSTDDSIEIIKNYSAKDTRIRYIDKKNEGISKTKKRGLDSAVGKYILFFDNDDIIYPEALETLYNLAEKKNADIVATPFKLLYPDKHREDSVKLNFKKTTGINYLNRLFCDKAHWPLWANFMKMDAIKNANVDFNYKLGIGEDMVTLVQILNTKTKVIACPIPLIDYRMRPESESHKITKQFYNDYIQCLSISENLMKKKGTYEAVRKSIKKAWLLRHLYGIFWGIDTSIPENLKQARKIIIRHPSAWKLMTHPMKHLMREYMIFPRSAIRKAYAIATMNNDKKYNM